MSKYLAWIDRLSRAVAAVFAWLIVALTLIVSYEVLIRKLFLASANWVFDDAALLYSAVFMMGGAYALSSGAHVRSDILYRGWPPRLQAAVDLGLLCSRRVDE